MPPRRSCGASSRSSRGCANTGALISVDTMKPAVAEAALEGRRRIVNDVRGLQGDPDMAALVARFGAGVIVMHNPGCSARPSRLTAIRSRLVSPTSKQSIAIARRAGISDDRDRARSGVWFGKSAEQNLELLARFCRARRDSGFRSSPARRENPSSAG